mmetsp:Transcript_11959/g.21755  ORF Transcript_11959/g.21755 Transcript_11959/m.21755 type:complete len:300 (-) Transcript_11959:248-1147(-)
MVDDLKKLGHAIFKNDSIVLLVEDENIKRVPEKLVQVSVLKLQIDHMLNVMNRVNHLLGNQHKPVFSKLANQTNFAELVGGAEEYLNLAEQAAGIVTEIANLFRVEYTVSKGEGVVTLPNEALRAAVAHEMEVAKKATAQQPLLRRKKWTIRLNHVSGDPASSEVMKRYHEILQVRGEIVAATALIDDDNDPLKQTAIACVKRCNDFVQKMTSVEEGQALSPLAEVVLHDMRAGVGTTHLLYVSCVASGGNQIVRNGLLCCCCPVTFKGGTSVMYILASVDGRIIASNSRVEISTINST